MFNTDVSCSLQLLQAGSPDDSHEQLVKNSVTEDHFFTPSLDIRHISLTTSVGCIGIVGIGVSSSASSVSSSSSSSWFGFSSSVTVGGVGAVGITSVALLVVAVAVAVAAAVVVVAVFDGLLTAVSVSVCAAVSDRILLLNCSTFAVFSTVEFATSAVSHVSLSCLK